MSLYQLPDTICLYLYLHVHIRIRLFMYLLKAPRLFTSIIRFSSDDFIFTHKVSNFLHIHTYNSICDAVIEESWGDHVSWFQTCRLLASYLPVLRDRSNVCDCLPALTDTDGGTYKLRVCHSKLMKAFHPPTAEGYAYKTADQSTRDK